MEETQAMGPQKYTAPWTEAYSDQIRVRLQKKDEMENLGLTPYKNGLTPKHKALDLIKQYDHLTKEEIGETPSYSLAGRVLAVRDFGKTTFLSLDDSSAKMQIYLKNAELSEIDQKEFQFLDYGDIVYVEGTIFKTQKGELTLKARRFIILTKSLRPLPEKYHGITDPELRYRMRYVDMIMDEESRKRMADRSLIIRRIREFFYKRDYLEVETPMLHDIVGGASARPFHTHHNTLDMDLCLRISPELHLKRLIIGGFPRVFEMNRNFRNEGISLRHNPEFTMIEFYQTYATYEDMMRIAEDLLSELATELHGKPEVTFGDHTISFQAPFKRLTMIEAICLYSSLTEEDFECKKTLREKILKMSPHLEEEISPEATVGRMIEVAFEAYAERHLIQPTFITNYPSEISPLTRRNEQDPNYVDRFELFINGWEVANAYSELNDPVDQLERFGEQAYAKEMGDDEATDMDYDFIRALEYGMPPLGGQGIGIDRICMLLTNSKSIRDVLAFPLLKKENFFGE